MKITLENLSRKEGLNILNHISDQIKFAVQGKQECRYVWGNNITATLKPEDVDGGVNFSKNTLELVSDYFTESTLKSFLPEEYNQ